MAAESNSRGFTFDGFRVDLTQRLLLGRDDQPVPLPSRAFDTLVFLLEHPGVLHDKRTLMKAVWPDVVVEENSLNQNIMLLRRALGEQPGENRFIATVPGRGFQFVAAVSRVEEPSPEVAAPSAPSPRPSRARTFWLPVAAGAAVIAVAGGYFVWNHLTAPGTATSGTSVTVTIPTIVVLPFDDLSPAHDQEYFADGLADELSNQIGRIDGLRVIGRISAMYFKGRNRDSRTIGKQLGARYILTGSVRRDGEQLRITAALVDATTDSQVWTEAYNQRFSEILSVQSDIAQKVVGSLAPRLLASDKVAAGPGPLLPKNPEAYAASLRARHYSRRGSIEGFKLATQEAERAVALDPTWVDGHLQLATSYRLLIMNGGGDSARLGTLAREQIEAAVKLDPTNEQARVMSAGVGSYGDAPVKQRIPTLERTVASNPNNPMNKFSLFILYEIDGRRDDARRMLEEAYLGEPLAPVIAGNLAIFNYRWGGDLKRTLDLADEIERIAPGNQWSNMLRGLVAQADGRASEWDKWATKSVQASPRDVSTHVRIAGDYAEFEDYGSALYHARTAAQLDPSYLAAFETLILVLVQSGDVAGAKHVLDEVLARHPLDRSARTMDADFHYATGDCAGVVDPLAYAVPGLARAEPEMDLSSIPHAPAMVWCLRALGQNARADVIVRAFWKILDLPSHPAFNAVRARMAAATGDRAALVRYLEAVCNSNALSMPFWPQDPLFRPFAQDAQVSALLKKLEARRAEWRSIVTRASTRVPVPLHETAAR